MILLCLNKCVYVCMYVCMYVRGKTKGRGKVGNEGKTGMDEKKVRGSMVVIKGRRMVVGSKGEDGGRWSSRQRMEGEQARWWRKKKGRRGKEETGGRGTRGGSEER